MRLKKPWLLQIHAKKLEDWNSKSKENIFLRFCATQEGGSKKRLSHSYVSGFCYQFKPIFDANYFLLIQDKDFAKKARFAFHVKNDFYWTKF